MNHYEARAKAYFIASLLTHAIAEHMPDLFAFAAEKLEIPQADMDAVRREMEQAVSTHLHEQGLKYKAAAQVRQQIRKKRP